MSKWDQLAAPNHWPVRSIDEIRSHIICSRRPAKQCIVFVHGFNGEAIQTWDGFNADALKDPALAETDLIFFGYDGLNSNALAASSFLFDLLDSVMSDGALIGRQSPPATAYASCVLAGHSLGALVTRWALIRAYEQKLPWLDKIRYILFAPAHSGGIIVDSVTELLGSNPISKFLGNLAKAKIPLLQELRQGSPMLKCLEDKTKAALTAGCTSLRPRRVLIAEFELIVSNIPFPGDPYPTAIRKAEHTTVCKLSQFPQILAYVKELL